jgi:transposase
LASGGAFHRAYTNATQQAFLEAHELAFAYFGGVFATLRYDNLKLAVKKILRGYQRDETARMLAFRSHWGFQSEYCNPVWPENSIYLKQREIIPGVVDNETIRCQSAWTRSAFC